jgi:hypothetical protein
MIMSSLFGNLQERIIKVIRLRLLLQRLDILLRAFP